MRFLGQEDTLEEEMATHSSILAWKIPWTEEPGGLHSSWGHRIRPHLGVNSNNSNVQNWGLQLICSARGHIERSFLTTSNCQILYLLLLEELPLTSCIR